jgi:hypothetical protein
VIAPYAAVLLCLVTALCFLAVGHLAGRYAERRAWNALIEDGRLPRPAARPR